MHDLLHRATDVIAVQQDYLWFLCILAWLAVAQVGWRPTGGEKAPRWLLVLSLIQVAAAGGELVHFLIVPESAPQPWRGWEWGAAIALAAQVSALAWSAGRIAGITAAVASTTAVIWQMTRPLVLGRDWPVDGHLALGIVAGVVALLLARTARGGTRSVLALSVLLGVVVSANGAAAELSHEARRWTELSLFTLPAAAVSLFGAGCAWVIASGRPLVSLWRETDSRRMLRNVAALLAAGFGLAWLSGQLARQATEHNLLSRAQTAAMAVDVPAVEKWLRDDLHFTGVRHGMTYARRPMTLYETPAIDQPAIQPLRQFLKRIGEYSTDLRYVHFSILRKDEVIIAVYPRVEHDPRGVVACYGRATPRDHEEWAAQRPHVLPPSVGPRGSIVQARAPVLGATGQIIGWLTLDISATRWAAEQARTRLVVLAAIGLGLGLVINASRHRRTAEARAAAERAAEEARASERAKTAFLAQISHELRTPIQSVLGYGELLRGTGLNPSQRRWTEAQRSHGEMLLRLVNDLLDSFSLQTGSFRLDPKPGRLGAVLSEAVRGWSERTAAAGGSLSFTETGENPSLAFDEARVRQVLNNLVGNAVKFAPGCRITVHLETAASAPGSSRCRLIVIDEGPGIAPADQARLFQPFVRLAAAQPREGTGLGLAISRGLCRAMGGDLTVTSDGRSGTSFTAAWHLGHLDESAGAEKPVSTPVQATLRGLRVLVTDDNALVRELFIDGLRAAGALVVGASDGSEALARAHRETFEAVVLDLSMPGMDGDEVAVLLRRAQPQLRIIGVSAHANLADRDRALAAGMDGFLAKPARLADLVALLHPGAVVETSSPTAAGLLARLHREFLATRPALAEALADARLRCDWPQLARRAHHLKSSADLLQLPELSAACAAAYAAAETEDEAAADRALIELTRLLGQPEAALSRP